MRALELASKYRRELFESVIPFWLRHSLDRECGGCFTGLDRDGSLYDPRKYVWMQGRAVWMFCRLYNTVERRAEWLEAARGIVEFLRRHARAADGRVWFSLTREGHPVYRQRKPYSAFFLVLAYTEWFQATGDESYLAEAVELFDNVRDWIANPAQLGRPSHDGGPPMSRLADIMVLASMAMELLAARPDDRYHDVIAEALRAVGRHWDPDLGLLLENIAPRELPEGRLFCPGSAIEVAWFLLHALEVQPDARKRRFLLDVIERSLDSGWDPEYGGLFYFMDCEGKPPAQLEAGMKLWWPHTEAIYGCALAWKLTGDDEWLRRLDRVDAWAFDHFADPEHGEWFGYCDRRGALTHTLKGGAYKGFFHVPRCLLFSAQALGG